MNVKNFAIQLIVILVLSCLIGFFAYPEPFVTYDGFLDGVIWGPLHGTIFIGNWILGNFVYDSTQHLMYSGESGLVYKFCFWMAAMSTVAQIIGSLFYKGEE